MSPHSNAVRELLSRAMNEKTGLRDKIQLFRLR